MRHPSEIILDPNDVEMEFLDLDSARVGLAGPGEILIYAIEYKGNRYSVRLSYSDGYLYITNVFGPDYEKPIPSNLWPMQEDVRIELLSDNSFSISYSGADEVDYSWEFQYEEGNRFRIRIDSGSWHVVAS